MYATLTESLFGKDPWFVKDVFINERQPLTKPLNFGRRPF